MAQNNPIYFQQQLQLHQEVSIMIMSLLSYLKAFLRSVSRCEHNETMAVVVEAADPSYQEFEAWRLASVEAGARPGLGGARPGDTEGRGTAAEICSLFPGDCALHATGLLTAALAKFLSVTV